MAITTLSSRAFNQHASGAKRAANQGPVFHAPNLMLGLLPQHSCMD